MSGVGHYQKAALRKELPNIFRFQFCPLGYTMNLVLDVVLPASKSHGIAVCPERDIKWFLKREEVN